MEDPTTSSDVLERPNVSSGRLELEFKLMHSREKDDANINF